MIFRGTCFCMCSVVGRSVEKAKPFHLLSSLLSRRVASRQRAGLFLGRHFRVQQRLEDTRSFSLFQGP